MLRNGVAVLAIVLVIGSSGLSTSAFAGDGGGADGFRGNHFSGLGGTPDDGYDGYGSRGTGLRGGFREYV
jgi:hypothetical protein